MEKNWKNIACRNEYHDALRIRSEKLNRSMSNTLELILQDSLKSELKQMEGQSP